MNDADDHDDGILLPLRAAHPPRRTGHADRLGGHRRPRQGGLLPGEGIPPAGPLLRGVQAAGAPPAGRLDGSPSSRITRGPRASLRSDTPTPYTRKETRHEPRRVHRHLQGGHRPAGGGVLPAALPAIGERRHAPPPAPHTPGSAGGRHQGRGPLPRSPPGNDGGGRNGHRKNVHRRFGSTHGGLQAHLGALPAPPRAQVEARGRADGAGRTRRHRRVHHRPGAAAPLHRLRPPLCGDEPGEGQAVLPLAGRRHLQVGNVQGQAGTGRGDGGAVPGPLLPRLHGADHGQGRRAPDRRRPEPQAARLPRLRLPPLAGRQVRPEEVSARRLREAPHEGLLRPADNGRGARVQGARLGAGHRRRSPRRRLRQVPLPERHPHGRLQLDAVPPPLQVQPGDSDGVRALRGGALDRAVRLRRALHRQARRRVDGGRTQQQAQEVPQGGQGEAGARPVSPLPPHRQHHLPAPLRRGLGAAGLHRADTPVLDGLGEGRDRLLPAQRLRHRVRRATQGAGRGPQERLKETARHLPANPVGLPGRVHQGGDGLRPQVGRRHRAGAAPVRGQALPQGAGAHRPGGRRAHGGAQGAGLRDPHGDAGHHRADGRHPHPARLPGGGDEGRRRGPQQEGEVGGRQGEAGHRRDDLPPQAGADGPRSHRLPDDRLGRDRVSCFAIDTTSSVGMARVRSTLLLRSMVAPSSISPSASLRSSSPRSSSLPPSR